jgi:hypothetical protein
LVAEFDGALSMQAWKNALWTTRQRQHDSGKLYERLINDR